MRDIDYGNTLECGLEEVEDNTGCFKASLTVEASFILVITMGVLLALFLLMFIVYHENVDFVASLMKDYSIDSVKEFRLFFAFKQLELIGGK